MLCYCESITTVVPGEAPSSEHTWERDRSGSTSTRVAVKPSETSSTHTSLTVGTTLLEITDNSDLQ